MTVEASRSSVYDGKPIFIRDLSPEIRYFLVDLEVLKQNISNIGYAVYLPQTGGLMNH